MDNDGLFELSRINVTLKESNREVVSGNLCLSKHHMMIAHSEHSENDFYMLLKAIDIIRMILPDNVIEIRTKNFKLYQLQMSGDGKALFDNLEYAIKNDVLEESFPFVFKPTFNVIEDGWTAFPLKEECTELLISGIWGLITNEVCSSYDKSVIVPIETTVQNITDSARIHAKERFPVLAFYDKQTQSSLLRCSQYTSSIEKMASVDPLIKVLKYSYCFADIRSKNVIKNIPLEGRVLKNAICPMEKLDVLLSNFQKFIEACQEPPDTPVDRYLGKLESSQWLDRVRSLLSVSRYLAHSMKSKQSNYIVIGDTGCDYELIISSLVQVILKHDARTLRGFEALIDREWIQAGHPFWDRCKRFSNSSRSSLADGSNGTESPVFILFLDCVWQIMQFNPTSFEFNELFLKSLAHHAYYSDYGTFLGNSAEHRRQYCIPTKTTSLWSYINQETVMMGLLNSIYDPTGKDSHDSICWPPVQPQNIQIWRELYGGQSIRSIDVRRKVQEATVQHYKTSKNHNQQLRKILESLETEMKNANLLKL